MEDFLKTLAGGDFNQEVLALQRRWPQLFRVSSDACRTRGYKWTCASGTRTGTSYRQIVRAKVLRLKHLRSDHSPVKISYNYVGITGWKMPVLRFQQGRRVVKRNKCSENSEAFTSSLSRCHLRPERWVENLLTAAGEASCWGYAWRTQRHASQGNSANSGSKKCSHS